MSRRAERLGVRMGFGLLGVLGVVLIGRLGQLQLVGGASAALRSVARQGDRERAVPAARGTILDRNGELLAYDRPIFEIRAEARFPTPQRDGRPTDDYVRKLSTDLAWALFGDAEHRADHAGRRQAQKRLSHRIRAAKPRRHLDVRVPRKRGETAQLWRRSIDFLVADSVDAAVTIERLRKLAENRSSLHLHFRTTWERVYPGREATHGLVGHVGEIELPDGGHRVVETGIEKLPVLDPGRPGTVRLRVDARARQYFEAPERDPEPPAVVQTTLDLVLQQQAVRLLDSAVAAVEARYQSPPEWGALTLVEIATGDVLAMASFRRGVHPAAGAFAPLQSLCAPGSVVKPLVFAVALERGLLDWDRDRIDCRPNRPNNGWRVPAARRTIRDAHRCDVISAHDILVQSSNIGAVKVGLRLGRDGFAEFLDLFRFARVTACGLSSERAGTIHPADRDLVALRDKAFLGYTAPSYSIGYEYNVTPIQVARAYLTLLSGRKRDLRLFRRYRIGARTIPVPRPASGPRVLSEATLARLRAALTDVVSDADNATGKPILERLRALGHDYGTVAGKTGTSEEARRVGGRRVTVRTALFAGFTPVDAPRHLAVCVLQKERASSFWGGRYAGPAAAELLLEATARAAVPRRPARKLADRSTRSGVASRGVIRAPSERSGSGI